ncbi:MAG: sulfate adenylyltransferase, partial [Planctomycetota bacterium]|nr:sulfate adenylyltransferase [Planctomycetota bacterium]
MTSTLSNVSPVHGGLSEPVNRIDPSATSETGLPTVEVQDVDHTTLYRIADGTLSPLEGPMGEKDYNDVLAKGAIERNGGAWAWTIPVILPVTDAEAALCAVGAEISLVHGGSAFGTLEVDSVFDWDKDAFIKAVYRTERTDHPGARLWTSDERTKLVGGTICLLPSEDTRSFAERVMGPNQTRALVAEQGWEQSIAFQTRNPLHRAHEYALV